MNGEPLTVWQLQHDIFESTKKFSKADLREKILGLLNARLEEEGMY